MPWGVPDFYPAHPADLLGVMKALESLQEEGVAADAYELAMRLRELGYEQAMVGDDEGTGSADPTEDEQVRTCEEILAFLAALGWTTSRPSVSDGPSLSEALQQRFLGHKTLCTALLEVCFLARFLRTADPECSGVLLPEFASLISLPPDEMLPEFDDILTIRKDSRQRWEKSLENLTPEDRERWDLTPEEEEMENFTPGDEEIMRMAIGVGAYDDLVDSMGAEQAARLMDSARRTLRYFIATGLLAYGYPFEEVQTVQITPRGDAILSATLSPETQET